MNKKVERVYKIFGLPESRVREIIRDFRPEGFEIAFLPDFPEVHLKLSGAIKDDMDERRIFRGFDRGLKKLLGSYLFGIDDETLESVLGRLLVEHGKTLATAESITGGLLSHRLTNVPGSSRYFNYSVVSYSNESKIKLLNIKRDSLRRFGAVSGEVAVEMAHGVRKVSGADIGLSVTGIAGPTGGSKEKPVGTVFLGLSTKENEYSSKYFFPDMSRDKIKAVSAASAMELLRRFLIKAEPFNG